MKRNHFKFRAHFSKLGWTEIRDSGDVLWFEGTQLEALEIQSEKQCIKLTVLNSIGETVTEYKRAGTTGRSIAIKALSLKDEEVKNAFLYRVYLRKIGWTQFVKDGEMCGTPNGSESLDFTVIEGIQIICLWNDRINKNIEYAERKLAEYEKICKSLFVVNKYKMLEAATRNNKRMDMPEVIEVVNGGVLPLQKIDGSRNGIFRGGVCDSNNKFIAGHVRKSNVVMNLSCMEGYESDNFEYSDEEVIFGGILIGFFGHALTECTARLWWILQNMQNESKIVLLKAPETGTISTQFFELAGIPVGRLQFVEKATRYRKVIVPEQSILLWEYVYPEAFLLPYNKMKDRVKAAQYKKIYLVTAH